MEGGEFHVSEGTDDEFAGDEGDQKAKRNQDYACVFSVKVL
jgi:hypothetical protein